MGVWSRAPVRQSPERCGGRVSSHALSLTCPEEQAHALLEPLTVPESSCAGTVGLGVSVAGEPWGPQRGWV